ncbi:MAG: PQQ-binding-like beta-propeller repeat protein [Acidobacteria bacterium]|nr:PQQ-binding-like beta-propeller repeat protein [Acidobacteriota bacterium]
MRPFLISLLLANLPAADWLQWGGPKRSFQIPAGVKIPRWPATGPKQIWTRDLGDGYSSMVTAGGNIYTLYRKGAQDVVIALSATTGETVWENPINAAHTPDMNVEAGPGPHSTPLIVNNRLFVTTVVGQLHALDLNTGKRIWSHDLWTEYKGTRLDRGYASSPIAYKDAVIVPVGGRGHALMAFRQDNGDIVWSKGDMQNAFSSPILISAGGRDQLVTFMAREVMGADAATGDVLWSVGHQTQYDINAATPAWCEDIGVLVVASGYDGGARGIKVDKTAKELWHHKRLRVHHTNMVCKDGVVYGSSGDFGPAPFTAVEAETGKVLWQDRAFTKASFLLAGNTMLATDDDGSVAMATISRDGFKLLGEAQLLRSNSWTVPLLLDSRLIIRDRHRIAAIALESPAQQ